MLGMFFWDTVYYRHDIASPMTQYTTKSSSALRATSNLNITKLSKPKYDKINCTPFVNIFSINNLRKAHETRDSLSSSCLQVV